MSPFSIYIFMSPGRTWSVKHILSFRRSTLATASKKYFLKMATTEKYMSYFGLHFKKLLTWYQSGTRPQNYFYNLYIARTSPGHSEDNILKFPTLNSSLKEMMTFHEQLRFVGKKNVTILSTHNILSKASTSVWNNYRDHLVDFDWQHMFQRVNKHWNSFDSPIKSQQKQFLLLLCQKYAR